MKAIRLVVLAATLLLTSACNGSKVASRYDTYLSAKEREKLNKFRKQMEPSNSVDSREDNFSRFFWVYDADYCYSYRVCRYSTGVWYDPWWWGFGWSPTWSWRSWCIHGWGWWDTWWSWSPDYTGPGWYYTPGWGWTYYAGRAWLVLPSGTSLSYNSRYNYRPRTYITPSGSTTYTPPRGTVVTPGNTPPRRSTAPAPTTPSRPSYVPTSPYPTGSSRPSIQSGSTGAWGIHSSSPAGGIRPR
jgi:hypothetical protein